MWEGKEGSISNNCTIPAPILFGNGEPGAEIALCDNVCFLQYLLEQGREVDLIYIDPPFLSGKGYTQRIRSGDGLIVKSAYEDRGSLDDYMSMIYPRLRLMHSLLSSKGTIFFHGDRRIIHHVRVLMDEIFGFDNLVNEIIWTYTGGTDRTKGFGHKHDTILMYKKGNKFTFNPVYVPFSEGANRRFNKTAKDGRRYKENTLKDGRKTRTYMKKEGKICPDYWHFNIIVPSHSEHTGYRTQKPKELLRRIILSASNPGDTVADFFMGSGSTGVVALEEGRKFIGVDKGYPAFDTALAGLSGNIMTYRDWKPRGSAEYSLIRDNDHIQLNEYQSLKSPLDTVIQDSAEIKPVLFAAGSHGRFRFVRKVPFLLEMKVGNFDVITLDNSGTVTKRSFSL